MTARLVDRGNPDTIRMSANADRRTAAIEKKRRDAADALEKRREMALQLCRRDGHVSGRTLAIATGAGVRTCDGTLADMATSGTLARSSHGQRGYVFADPDPDPKGAS